MVISTLLNAAINVRFATLNLGPFFSVEAHQKNKLPFDDPKQWTGGTEELKTHQAFYQF